MNIEEKIQYWKSRLLDLGKRNRAIYCPIPSNARISRTSLLISKPNYSQIFDIFSQNKKGLVFPNIAVAPDFDEFESYENVIPVNENNNKKEDENIDGVIDALSKQEIDFLTSMGLDSDDVYNQYKTSVSSNLKTENIKAYENKPVKYFDIGKGLLVNQSLQDTVKTLTNLKKKSKEFFDEKGINSLCIAVGFLKWKENPSISNSSSTKVRSPLVLLPAKITQANLLSEFVISPADDDITVNFSLYKKLENDFKLVLPDFDENCDLQEYFANVEKLVQPLGWSISYDCVQLTMFSFTKINMYNDLIQNEENIKNHKIIRALNGESILFDEYRKKNIDLDIKEFDNINPETVFSILDSDSSQQEAIELAKKGVSFVIQGPPGTGKSQTITNIIAELIADGKSVLFVSEKAAALDVVYKRLQACGIGEFVLSLHSHNANKKEVLTQLERTIKLAREKREYKYRLDLKLLLEARTILNNYVEQLHTDVDDLEKTVYDINGEVAALNSVVDVDFFPKNTTKEYFESSKKLLQDFASILKEAGYQNENPWNGTILTSISYTFRQEFVTKMDSLKNKVFDAINLSKQINDIIGLEKNWSYNEFENLNLFSSLVKKAIVVPENWIYLDIQKILPYIDKCFEYKQLVSDRDVLQKQYESITELISIKKTELDAQKQILKKEGDRLGRNFNPAIMELNGKAWFKLYTNSYNSFFGKVFSKYKRDNKTLIGYSHDKKNISYTEALETLKLVAFLQNQIANVAKLEKEFVFIQNNYEKIKDSYWNVKQKIDNMGFSQVLKFLSDEFGLPILESFDFDILKSKMDWLVAFLAIANFYNCSDDFKKSIVRNDEFVINNFSDICDNIDNWITTVKSDFEYLFLLFESEKVGQLKFLQFEDFLHYVTTLGGGFNLLESYIDYKDITKKCNDFGLSGFIDEIAQKNISYDKVVLVFEKCFYRKILDKVFFERRSIASFRRNRQEELIQLFCNLDKTSVDVQRENLQKKLIAKLPEIAKLEYRAEFAILTRELTKKVRQLPIRQLMNKIENVIHLLKPCFMMSPLSVSTYFANIDYTFDTVIFDEASQVRTEDSICAIYRSKQTIISGDSKQMPPSNFFSTAFEASDNIETEDDYNDAGAYESLLEEAAMLPQKMLKWHYRSKHEDLICFSNQYVYGGDLVTFPSSIGRSHALGVRFEYVPDGRYNRGGKTGNQIEARRVAQLVFEHFRTNKNRSLCVIAFGMTQQAAIEKEIYALRRDNPQFEVFFDDSILEPFVVKNLETSQGDERDTVILSVGYAPDYKDKMSQNFGPLSGKGGERRLNVAITRARYNMILVSSILDSDIKNTATMSKGRELIAKYIKFANLGKLEIEDSDDDKKLDGLEKFEDTVYNFLLANGYEVCTNVGCSGYRLDFAVKHPTKENQFVLGIECDGKMYNSAKTARDRDRLRHSVLKAMGWNIYKIWSTDWIKDVASEEKRLLEAIKSAVSSGAQ